MPALDRALADMELQRLIQTYLKAETDIINEIGRLRSLGLVDYHAEAALDRVQAILRKLEGDGWEYVPRMIERQFYVSHPQAREPSARGETPEKHLAGYKNAAVLTGEQMDIVQRLTMNLMGELTEAHTTVYSTLSIALIGRTEPDVLRRVGLEQTGLVQAAGRGVFRAVPDFVEALRREGVTAFVDKAGRNWSLHTYAGMALRTTSRQAEVLSVLTRDDGWDLYKISRHGTTCRLCAGFEGRVYSKSGRDPDFPPLSAAFGKMDPAGPDTLDNSWLNIHPNCLHQLIRWTPMGRGEEEIQKIKDFSSFEKNPPSRDPRTQKQIDAYREKQRSRARRLENYRQWERYRETLGDGVPRTFETFLKHKTAGDEKYKGWKTAYRRSNALENSRKHDILKDTEYTGIPVTEKAIQRVPQIRPEGWSAGQAERLQEAHRELLRAVKDKPIGTEAGAVYSPDMKLIERRIGTEAGHQIILPRYTDPHILIHSHPSGLTFSKKDIESFITNFNMTVFTAVGNNGAVYSLQKTEQYDAVGFVKAFGATLPKLGQAKTPQDYAETINRFLREAEQHGIKFVKGG